MFSNYHLTNPAIVIIALVLLASVFSVYFCKRHKSKLAIAWTVVTVLALLLPIILMLSNWIDFWRVNNKIVDAIYPPLERYYVPHYDVFGWMTTVAGSGGGFVPDIRFTSVSTGGIIAISCASAIALASIVLTAVQLVKFRSLKLSKLSIVGMLVAVTLIVFVILFLFAIPVLQGNDVTREYKLFNFWRFTGARPKK